MIYEYAIEPKIISLWASSDRDYAEFFREYGLGTPRIISNFPKSKTSKFRSYLLRHAPENPDSLQGMRYTEMVLKIAEATAQRECQTEQDDDWRQLVAIENNRLPFDVILTNDSIDMERNITLSSMYTRNSIWSHDKQKSVQRTNEKMLETIGNFIKLSSDKIIIVDTYGWTDESINFIRELLNLVQGRQLNSKIPDLSLFYKDKRGGASTGVGSPTASYVKSQILKHHQGFEPSKLSVFCLREKPENDIFHNRCILSELGGMLMGHGIGVSGVEHHTDDLALMEVSIYLKKWQLFSGETTYEVVSKA